jgi:cytoskeletal protein CcmA (bactofilin family)
MDNSNNNPEKTQDPSQSNIDTTSTNALTTPAAAQQPTTDASGGKSKMPGALKKYTHRFNIYLLLFVLILVVAGAVLVIMAMSSKEETADPTAIDSQSLSSDTLKQLSNTDATVGDPKQVLNVQSNAIFAGKVLVRDNLEVAGTIRVGGALSLPGITVSGESNFDQINVQKAMNIGGDATVQGQLNIRRNLAVSGTGTFGGALTAPSISTTSLQLLGDLIITKHLIIGGSSPGRGIGGAVGSGGTASVSGSDTSGSVNVNTGSGPGAGCFITVNFTQKFNNTPHVLLTPVGSDAGSLDYYVTRTSSGFSICTTNVPPSNSSFGFDYFVAG